MPNLFYPVRLLLSIALIVTGLGCEGGKMADQSIFDVQLSKIPDSAWRQLSEKRIYFGHQSVGRNIIEGIGDIKALESRISLKIAMFEKHDEIKEPGFYHSPIGVNEDPESKIDDFAKKIESGIGNSADIAFFKFCYVDVNPSTDVPGLFSHYKNTINRLKNKYQGVTFIHSTIPLVKLQTGPKAWVKRILGKPISGINDNIKRDEYNRLLVVEYSGKDPIFDLARIESTYPNGTRSTISKENRVFPTLIPEWTYDNGHLNKIGRRAVATTLLIFLSQLPHK